MNQIETEDFDIIDKAELQSFKELKKVKITEQLDDQIPLLQ